jgi:hypothetical protein
VIAFYLTLARIISLVMVVWEVTSDRPSPTVLAVGFAFIALSMNVEGLWPEHKPKPLSRDTDLRRVYPVEDYRGERDRLPTYLYAA